MDIASGRLAEDITWASLALLYYDYALTFDEEVALIWGMKFSSSTLLYIFCRYAMVANLLYLLAHMENLGMSCDVWYKVIALLGVLGRAAVIVTFTLRTYVVWAQSRLILASLVVIGVATVVTDAIFIPHQTCENTWGAAAAIDIVRSLLTVVFETMSAVLIFIRSLQAFRSSGIFSVRRNFTYFLMQEGAIYFCLVSLFTIATFVLKLSTDSKYLHDLLNAFTLPLSGVLTARFLLHLRSWNKSRSDAVSCTTAVDVDEEIASYDTSSQWSENITHLVSTGSVYSDTTSGWVSTAGFGEDPVVIVKRMLPQ